MRLAQWTRARGLTSGVAVAAIVGFGALACERAPSPSGGEVEMSWTLEPSSPTAGRQTRALVRLRDASGRPVRGARLQVEGHMTHPGMAPVIASAAERDAGIYEATIELTMPGNWTMVASGTLPDGRRLTRSLDVRDVR